MVRKLLGFRGAYVKSINEATGARLRLRGKGSGFKEGYNNVEASDPLMLCVSADDAGSYERAVRMVREHLEDVHRQYREFCAGPGKLPAPELQINMHEGPREGSR